MNDIIIYDNYAEIILMDKDGIECGRTKISVDKVNECKMFRWWMHHDGYVYCKMKSGTKPNGNGIWKNVQLSRFLAGTPNGLVCDHINHDTLDNRDENLRNCTIQQNAFNMSKMNGKNIRGIRKIGNKWYARLRFNRKEYSRGGFETEEEAMIARQQLENEFYGEFAQNKEEIK